MNMLQNGGNERRQKMKIFGLKIYKGDFDGLLGILVDNLSVFLMMISLNLYVVGMPADIVFGRIIPGAAIGLLAGNIYYAYMAKRIQKKEGREDVTALPCGISAVFVSIYTMGILYPVTKMTGDPELAWKVALVANFIGAFICMLGALIGPWLRRFLPSAAMLGPVAGAALMFIAGTGLRDIFANPVIGLLCLALVLWGYVGRGQLPFKIPAGLLSLIIGAVLAICMGQTEVVTEFEGVHAPFPWMIELGIGTIKECMPYLSIILPIAIMNFIGTLNNVELAKSAGDDFNVREAMMADAVASAIGGVFGCCYPNGVFYGHPGYKQMGARTTYSLMNGILLTLLAVFGLFSFINSIIPVAAVTPILIYVGVISTESAFTTVPKRHIAATCIAIMPFVCEFAMNQIDSAAKALGFSVSEAETLSVLSDGGVNYTDFMRVGNGTTLIAMILAALVVFMMERQMLHVSGTAFFAALLSAVGLIHSGTIGILPVPGITVAWCVIGALALAAHLWGIRPEKDAALAMHKETER